MAARERRLGYFALAALIIGVVFFTSPGGQFSILGDCPLQMMESPDGNGFQSYEEYRRAAGIDLSDEELQDFGIVMRDGTLHQPTCTGALE